MMYIRRPHGIVLIHTLFFFFFNDTATTEIYTLSLHDALPTSPQPVHGESGRMPPEPVFGMPVIAGPVTPLPHATGSKTEPQGFTAPEPVMPLQLAAAPVPET